MKLLKLLSLSLVLPAAMAVPALANPNVTSPYAGSTVPTRFTVTANASSCSNQPVTMIGYSMDTYGTITQSGTYLQQTASTGPGGHTVHVKAWGNRGAVCVTDVPVTVSTSSGGGASSGGDPGVSAPVSGSTVKAPFTLSAASGQCNGQATSHIGYSIDDSSYTWIVSGTSMSTPVSTGTGGHTLHVKAWGNGGATCVSNIAVTVSGTSSSTPSSANNVGDLQASGSWSSVHDAGTPGSSSGWTGLTSSPSRSGHARQLSTSSLNYGGQRYASNFSDNISAHNFVYDAWIFIKGTTAGVANLEMDLNQVIGNGWTVIMGMQCDGWSGTWDFTANKGSATRPNDQWIHSGARCNPKTWGANAWHHVQLTYSRTDAGYVTYKTVALDGATQTLNATVFSGFALGWGRTLLTNFQVDGATSYSSGSDIFLDNLNISSW